MNAAEHDPAAEARAKLQAATRRAIAALEAVPRAHAAQRQTHVALQAARVAYADAVDDMDSSFAALKTARERDDAAREAVHQAYAERGDALDARDACEQAAMGIIP